MSNTKNYLVVRASGGLSNRLQAVLGGIAYCLLTGRSLCVDWRDGLYSDDFSNVFSLWFNINGIGLATCQEVEAAHAQGASLTPIFWQDYLHEAIAVEYLFKANDHMSPQGRLESCYDIGSPDAILQDAKASPILVYWGWDLQALHALSTPLREKFPELNHLNDQELAHALFVKYVHPTPSVLLQVDNFYHRNFTHQPLGIHIRHSDLQSPLPRMLETLQKVHTQGQEIFLCTDNERVEKMVQRLYPHCVTRSKTFQGVNIPLHNYVPGISNVEKGFDAVVEMLILARCEQIIHYAPSSFARIAILASGISAHKVHAVT